MKETAYEKLQFKLFLFKQNKATAEEVVMQIESLIYEIVDKRVFEALNGNS
jgi:hypothetical protein